MPRDSVFCPKCGAQFENTGQSKIDLPKEESIIYEKKAPPRLTKR